MEEVTLWTLFETEDIPVLPYGGTSGWSGTPTSQARAEREDRDGTTSQRQGETIRLLAGAGRHGLTWGDLSRLCLIHHGKASGLLSTLHKAGRIERLKEVRQGSMVYVMPEYVDGRQTSPYRPNVSARLLTTILEEIEHDLAEGNTYLARQRIAKTLEAFDVTQSNRDH